MLAEHKMIATQPIASVRAIVGMNPLQREVLIKAVEREATRAWAAFDTVEEALDWLAEVE